MATPKAFFQRLDLDLLLRGRKSLKALIQRERVDWVAVASENGDAVEQHIVLLVDKGLKMIGFDSLPDDSWQITDQEASDLVLCATGEQQGHDVQRVLYSSGDQVKSLLWRTRNAGQLEIVAVTRGGQVTVHAWDPTSVAWRFVSAVKIPLMCGEGATVNSATLAMDEKHVFWLEHKSVEHRAHCDDSHSDSDDSSSGSSDGSSSSSGGEGGGSRLAKHKMLHLCCCSMNAGSGRQSVPGKGCVEDLFDLDDILSTGPTSRFENEVVLLSNVALQRRVDAQLLPASPVGAWGLFVKESSGGSLGRLAYFSHEMCVSEEPWDVVPHRGRRASEDSTKEPAWCVSAGVARTQGGSSGDFIVLHENGVLLRHAVRKGESPLTKEMCSLPAHKAKKALDLCFVGGLLGIITQEATLLLVEPSSGQVRQELQLPELRECDRAYQGRYVVNTEPIWRAVGPLYAPSLIEAPGGGGHWKYARRKSAVLWQKGMALWEIKSDSLIGVVSGISSIPESPLAPTLENTKQNLTNSPMKENVVGVEHDEDTHLVELMMSAWEKGDVIRASALADEVLRRLGEPSLLLALIPESRRMQYAESRRDGILGLSSALFPELSPPPPPPPPSMGAISGEGGGWDMATAVASHPEELLKEMCLRGGVQLSGEGSSGACVTVNLALMVAYARAWGCPHGMGLGNVSGECPECLGPSDAEVLCGGGGGGRPTMLAVLCRVVYTQSPFHLTALIDAVVRSGGGPAAYEAAGRLLPLSVGQGLLMAEKDGGGGGDWEEEDARTRAIALVLRGQGLALQGIRLLAEAGLWGDVTAAAKGVPERGGGRGAVLGAVIEGIEGWMRRGGAGETRGEGRGEGRWARARAIEALAAVADAWA